MEKEEKQMENEEKQVVDGIANAIDKQTQQALAREQFSNWKLAFAKAAHVKSEFNRTQKRMLYLQRIVNESTAFTSIASELYKKNKEKIEQVSELSTDLQNVLNQSFAERVRKIFNIVFGKKFRSRNYVVVDKDEWPDQRRRYAVMIGPEGFRYRYNVQSQPINSLQQFWNFLMDLDVIVPSLRRMERDLKMKGMDKVADDLELFKVSMPDMSMITEKMAFRVPLNEQVLFPVSEYNTSQFRYATRFGCDPGYLVLYAPSEKVKYEPLFIRIGEEFTSNSNTPLIAFMQLEHQFEAVLDRYMDLITPVIMVAREAYGKLQDAFGKEILLETL